MVAAKRSVEVSELVAQFDELEDPRSSINRKHPLSSVLCLSLMAVLAGADGPTGIRKWAEYKKDWLLHVLWLPQGLPSRDVIRRVLLALLPAEFQACFVKWLELLRGEPLPDELKHIAIDGKTMRRSHDRAKGLGPMHLVSAWLTQAGLTLGQVATEEKSNEITAIPELLRLIDIKGSVITIDAMGTQTAIVEAIVNGGGDYVLALKANQETTHTQLIDFIHEHVSNDFADVTHEQLIEENPKPAHGRRESRTYVQFDVPNVFLGQDKWKKLTSVGFVLSHRTVNGKLHTDIRYYLSSLKLNVRQFAKVIRDHWRIENTCHWSLDVTYGEDGLRTRHRRIAENLAWLRRFTLSLLKQHPAKSSLAMKRRGCAWDDRMLLQVLGFATT